MDDASGLSSDSTNDKKSGSDSIVPDFGSFFDLEHGFGTFWYGANSTRAWYSFPEKGRGIY